MKPEYRSGSWRILVYLGKDENGKRIYESVTRADKYECIEAASKLAKHHHEIAMRPSSMTLGEAIDKYVASKSNVLSPATIRGYSNIRRNHLQPEMDLQLRNINNSIVQTAINREAKSNSPKTVANTYGLLKTVIKEYSGKTIEATLPQKEDSDINIMTEEECQKLVKAIEGDPAETPILLALFLGLRRSEIIALEYSDWDSKNKVLNIDKASVPDKEGKFVIKTTKTRKSKRKLPVPDYLARKLDNCVTNKEKFCPIHISAVSRHLAKICEQEGIRHVGLHALRHQNASVMLLLGTPDKYAMERGGWSSNDTMKRIYQHTIDTRRNEANTIINDYFEDLATKNATEVKNDE